MSDFIEYPFLDKPPFDWRNKSDESASDCIIILHSRFKTSTDCIRKYNVHLRILSMSSDYFYKIPMINSQSQRCISSEVLECSDPCDGDLNIKFEDGKCCLMGSISQSLSELKQQIQERFEIPFFEQRLTPSRADDPRGSQMHDWRSLAASGFRKGDTLLLVREPWQQYDPSTKTLVLHLPDVCIRCVMAVIALCMHSWLLRRERFSCRFSQSLRGLAGLHVPLWP